MSVARVTELISASTKSFEDAIQVGVSRAVKTLKNVEGVWVANQKCVIKDGRIAEYRARNHTAHHFSDRVTRRF
jgi:dodecin